MKAIHHPIVGAPRYGDARRDADVRVDGAQGLMLHAWRLSHDGSLAALPATMTAPVPERFRALLRGTSIVVDDALAALADGKRPALVDGEDETTATPKKTATTTAKATDAKKKLEATKPTQKPTTKSAPTTTKATDAKKKSEATKPTPKAPRTPTTTKSAPTKKRTARSAR
jgi:outer membrane biosynthesis protein TonB